MSLISDIDIKTQRKRKTKNYENILFLMHGAEGPGRGLEGNL